MKKYLLPAMVFICCMFASCAQQTGTPVEYAKACDVENEKKYIEVSGYLNDKGGVFCSNTGGGPVRCGFKVFESPGEKGFSADIEQGSGANTVEKLQSGYKKEDIKIRDNSGNVIDIDGKVKLVGKMNVAKNASNPEYDVCYLTVTKIEKQ
jgi:hypothetical protein